MAAYLDILKQIIPQRVYLWFFVIIVASIIFAKTSSGIFKYVQKAITVVARLPLGILALTYDFILKLNNKEPLQYYDTSNVLYVGDGKFDLTQHLITEMSNNDNMLLDSSDELEEEGNLVILSRDRSSLAEGSEQRKKEKNK